MRLLSWNLNHRAARRSIPGWIADAVAAEAPDVAILTEYVEGPDHGSFVAVLARLGLREVSTSRRPARQNQVLIATRTPHLVQEKTDPEIHPAVPSNLLHVTLMDEKLEVIGFRMPAYPRHLGPAKRQTWDWLLSIARSLSERRAVIAGDFNTGPDDSEEHCGDCLKQLPALGWHHALPAEGFSWRHTRSGRERRIDHAFLSPQLVTRRAEYSWAFRCLGADAASGIVGRPDHAMLLGRVRKGP